MDKMIEKMRKLCFLGDSHPVRIIDCEGTEHKALPWTEALEKFARENVTVVPEVCSEFSMANLMDEALDTVRSARCATAKSPCEQDLRPDEE